MPAKYKVASVTFAFLADLLNKPTGLKIDHIIDIFQDPTYPDRAQIIYVEQEDAK
jgi:hypothetical protein